MASKIAPKVTPQIPQSLAPRTEHNPKRNQTSGNSPRVPGPGETLTSNSFSTGFGGKGANQAVACARLASKGTKVAMVGNVGDDNFGRDYFEALGKEGINADGVSTVKGETTGAANIVVEEETGENRIMFTPGANVAFSKEYDQGWDLVPSDAGIVVCQLEIPIDVVCLKEFCSIIQRAMHVF